MLSLTRKSDYALVALSLLAKRWHAGDGPISAREVAERFGLPKPLLMNVFKELAQARILDSTRGVAGGYALAAHPAQLTVLEVVTALEGPPRLATCADGLPIVGQAGCPIESGCPIREPIRRIHVRLLRLLGAMTLQELLDDETPDPTAEAPAAAHPLGVPAA